MPLKAIASDHNTVFDVISVPAIGAEPASTWQISGVRAGDQRSIFHGLKEARVYFYTFPAVSQVREYDINFYAIDLLRSMLKLYPQVGRRPFHIAVHSTGALVVKRALVIARNDQNYLRMDKSCFSIAFWGAPHHGSTVLADEAHKYHVAELLGLRFPMGSLLRDDFRGDYVDDLNEDFAPLALKLKKIWSFAEGKGTTFKVTSDKLSVAELNMPVVDRRSATLNRARANLRIGCEEVITIPTEHSKLARFGNDETALQSYISDLQGLIESIVIDEQHKIRSVEHEVKASVHFFYRAVEGVKLWSDRPLVHDLFEDGPNLCLHRRLRDMRGLSPDKEDNMSLEVPNSSNAVPGIVVITDDELVSQSSTASPDIPSAINSVVADTRFISGNTREHATEEGSGVDERYREFLDDMDARHQEGHISAAAFFTPEELRPLHNNANGNQPVLKGIPSIAVGGAKMSEENHDSVSIDNTPLESRAERRGSASLSPNQPTELKKQFEQLKPKADKPDSPDLLHSPNFRWVHVPSNVMYWVPQLFQALAEERNNPGLCRKLLHESAWDSMHSTCRHGSPHGRFMRPGCRPFHPKLPRASTSNLSTTLAGPEDDVQLQVYFPYLNWDTFGSLMRRTYAIRRRIERARAYPVDDDVASGSGVELKIMWQYLDSTAGLPVHLRRSLDQYGYPTLANTYDRDIDQVLFKSTRPMRATDSKPAWQHLSRIARYQPTMTKGASSLAELINKDRKAQEKTKEASAKVLIIDQLWCWIVDSETVVTFFPPKESETAGASVAHGDLHSAIYNDINGDPQFATQCTDCFELAALAIYHAVTAFLEHMTEKDLQVFRIFEEYISILTEKQILSFKHFHTGQAVFSMAQRQRDDASHGDILDLQKTLENLHNSDDLNNLLELRDIEDELGTLRKLFEEQKTVLIEMLTSYKRIQGSGSNMEKGIICLEDALAHCEDYLRQVSLMRDACTSAEESYKSLLDMKQKQSNVVEAYLSRKASEVAGEQNRAIMIFTIFTIIFLPLSFFTSLFGMNASEWSGVESDPSLHKVFLITGCVSAAVIVVALVLAFNRPVRRRAHGIVNGSMRMIWRYGPGWLVRACNNRHKILSRSHNESRPDPDVERASDDSDSQEGSLTKALKKN